MIGAAPYVPLGVSQSCQKPSEPLIEMLLWPASQASDLV